MARPLVTIGISFFNNQDTLEDAIVSVLNQTFKDWELIMVDDGSVDRSAVVASRHINNRIRFIVDTRNSGLVSRLNQLVSLAAGKYFARMDADDLMHPERLSKQVEYLETHPEVDAVDCGMYSIDNQGKLTGIRGTEFYHQWTVAAILRGNHFNHATVLGHTSWFRRYPYDPNYPRAEDVELWCRSVAGSSFARIQEPLYYVREGDINVRNYIRGKKTLRDICRRYGPASLGWAETYARIVAAFGKEFLYRLFGFVGMQRVLSGLRNRPLTAFELMSAEGALNRARQRNRYNLLS